MMAQRIYRSWSGIITSACLFLPRCGNVLVAAAHISCVVTVGWVTAGNVVWVLEGKGLNCFTLLYNVFVIHNVAVGIHSRYLCSI